MRDRKKGIKMFGGEGSVGLREKNKRKVNDKQKDKKRAIKKREGKRRKKSPIEKSRIGTEIPLSSIGIMMAEISKRENKRRKKKGGRRRRQVGEVGR